MQSRLSILSAWPTAIFFQFRFFETSELDNYEPELHKIDPLHAAKFPSIPQFCCITKLDRPYCVHCLCGSFQILVYLCMDFHYKSVADWTFDSRILCSVLSFYVHSIRSVGTRLSTTYLCHSQCLITTNILHQRWGNYHAAVSTLRNNRDLEQLAMNYVKYNRLSVKF
jgi:hypothetical protein